VLLIANTCPQWNIQNTSENPSDSKNPAKILMESPSENASEIPSENSSKHSSGKSSEITSDNEGLASVL
jgi:hypothetical protein